MELVTIKNKFQIVIPRTIRERAHLGVGDLLEAGIENGKITFMPKSVIDRRLAEGLKDLAEGRTHGPYKTVEEAIAALEARTARKARSPRKRR